MNHEPNYIESWQLRGGKSGMECHDHIYENVTRDRYNYKAIINELIDGFASRARDLRLLRGGRDKRALSNYYSSMNPHYRDYESEMSSSLFGDTDADSRSSENSYAACSCDNIYENLEFFDHEIYRNDSLSEWMRQLAHDTADYEMDNIMFVKSIPSIFNVRHSRVARRNLNRSAITMNFIKTLWNREDNVDATTLLLQTFSSLLRDHNKLNLIFNRAPETQEQQKQQKDKKEEEEEEASSKKLVKLERSSKKCDKRTYQKFVCVILSVSLNSAVITYNRSQKFYSALVCSEVFFKVPSTVRARRLIEAISVHLFTVDFASESEQIAFYRSLRQLLDCKLRSERARRRKDEEKEEERRRLETERSAVVVERSESIYQQIWTCQSIASREDEKARGIAISGENIYASIEQVRVADDNEWEIDEEFSFLNPKIIDAYNRTDESRGNCENMTNQSGDDDYKTVWVLYSDENPDLNKFFYESSYYANYLNCPTRDNNHAGNVIELDDSRPPMATVAAAINHDIPEKFFDSVDAWKALLKSPRYMEDEEDIIISDSVLSANFQSFYDAEDASSSIKSVNASSNFSLPLDESSSVKSSHESYRSISEDALDSIPAKAESPKKERERFRDKVRLKLKMKSSRSSDISTDSTSIKSSDDDAEKFIVFGCNLEKVEKDGEYKDIPKIIVECIKALELEQNITTSGIYRISGNKVTIDAIRKKMNEKKSSKKESSKYASLIDQDVHTLTGLLKMFFRELNTPLMSRKTFAECTAERLSVSQMREILEQMPKVNYETLKHMFKHFKNIEKFQDENLMNSGNLAICLGLCLFSSNVETPNPFDNDISKCNMLCKYLIDNYSQVFENNSQR